MSTDENTRTGGSPDALSILSFLGILALIVLVALMAYMLWKQALIQQELLKNLQEIRNAKIQRNPIRTNVPAPAKARAVFSPNPYYEG